MSNINWYTIKKYEDILFSIWNGIAKITINRPNVYNAFRPETVDEIINSIEICEQRNDIDIVILTGYGNISFCSGGDQKVRNLSGYLDNNGNPKLNVLNLHKKIRDLTKPTIAMVNGYAIGGGNVLHLICDLTIASDNARFGQTGPKVGSFDGGFGSSYLARNVGQKKAREIWFLCKEYSATEALNMGLINKVVPLKELENTTLEWCKTIQSKSSTALKMIKRCLNAELDGQYGIMQLAGEITSMFYMTEESIEGKNAFLEKRNPNFKKYK